MQTRRETHRRHLRFHRNVLERVERTEVRDVVDAVDVGKVDELLVDLVHVEVFAKVLFSREHIFHVAGLDGHLRMMTERRNDWLLDQIREFLVVLLDLVEPSVKRFEYVSLRHRLDFRLSRATT